MYVVKSGTGYIFDSESLLMTSELEDAERMGHGDAAAIPAGDLADGHWYAGKGRNADIAFWDARNHTFWVTCLTDLVSPSDYPEPGRRTVRLKREKHRDDGGTFRPVREIR